MPPIDHLELEDGGFINLEDDSGHLILETSTDSEHSEGSGLLLWGVGF